MLPRRFLALVVDYLVFSALVFGSGNFLPYSDWAFLLSFVFSAMYFGVGNSIVIGGQTLGKRAFGLRVIDLTTGQAPELGKSFIRYFFTYGLLILLSELPKVVYRDLSFVAPSWILEAHMIPVMSYALADIASTLFSKSHGALHDRISGTKVVLTEKEEEPIEHSKTAFAIPALSGACLGFLLWWMGVANHEAVKSFNSKRFLLEHQHAIRVISASYQAQHLLVGGLVLSGVETSDEGLVTLGEMVTKTLESEGVFSEGLVKAVDYDFYPVAEGENSKLLKTVRVTLNPLAGSLVPTTGPLSQPANTP